MDEVARRTLLPVLWALLAMVGLGACSAPSLHGIHSAERIADDPALAGRWSDDSGDLSLEVEREGYGRFALRLTIPDDESSRYRTLRLDARLVELGDAHFGDLVLDEHERKALFSEYQALALRTHQIVKLERKGDTLQVWQLDEAELQRRIEQGKLSLDHAELDHADGGPDLVLTASTPKLQRVLAEHAEDDALFHELAVLHRWVRP